jgi:hypothetical protein
MRYEGVLKGLTALALLGCGGVASAQLAPGCSGSSGAPISATEEEYWFFMRELGGCLAKTKRAQSTAFMQTKIGTPEEKWAFDALISRRGNNSCMRNMVSASMLRAHVRGSVAEGLYETAPQAAPNAPVPQGLSAPATIRSIHDFADCYVAGNYTSARDLLTDTRLASKEENRRVQELASGFGACLPQGREIRIVPTDIRMALAEALYRASIARPAVAGGSN